MHRCSHCWYLLLLVNIMVICFVLGKDSELADYENDIDYDRKYEHTG